MNSLKRVVAGGETLLVESDGGVHGPFSLFLSSRFANPHSREVVSDALRILHRFLGAYKIDLAKRALDGEFLVEIERKRLARLVKHQLKSIELMTDRAIQRFVGALPTKEEPSRKGFVAKNTEAMRLHWINEFFTWYQQNILDEGIRSAAQRSSLRRAYANGVDELARRTKRAKEGHHNTFRSLPTDRYLDIMREVLINPEELFLSENGVLSPTWRRDRAITLLAMEGMRPGAIGNVTRDDYTFSMEKDAGYIAIKDNASRRDGPPTTGTPKAKGINNSSYASNLKMKLWKTTCFAIEEYEREKNERQATLAVKKSRSFMFLTEHGEPILNRSTISAVFNRLGRQLRKKGLLNVVAGDPYVSGENYDFTAYTLRHSAASFFYEANKNLPKVEDLMKIRFGWTARSEMPKRYANRSMSEHASVITNDFFDSLMAEVVNKRNGRL